MAKKKILLVDDEEDFTSLLKMSLESSGSYEVMTENNSLNAVSVALSFHPDLIFLDIMMPHMDGSAVAERLKEEKLTQDIPIIFLTGAVTRSEIGGEDGKIGGRVFLAKPISIRELRTCIEKYIPV